MYVIIKNIFVNKETTTEETTTLYIAFGTDEGA